jgi:hypothetical protein
MMIMLAFAQAVASDQQQIMQILLAHQRRQQDLFIALGIALGFHTGLSIYRLRSTCSVFRTFAKKL